MRTNALPIGVYHWTLIATTILCLIGWAHSPGRDDRASAVSVHIASISFSGPGLDGVPTWEPYNDLNNNNVPDPGEPWDDTLIAPPEYVPAFHRNKNGYMVIGTRFHVKVAVTIKNVEVHAASISAACSEHPELDLPEQALSAESPASSGYYAILQIPAPLKQIRFYENFSWRWTVKINGASYSDTSNNTIAVDAGTGEWVK